MPNQFKEVIEKSNASKGTETGYDPVAGVPHSANMPQRPERDYAAHVVNPPEPPAPATNLK